MTDEFKEQQTSEHQVYEQWLAKRREVDASPAMSDQIMSRVADLDLQRREIWWLRLIEQVERTRVARWCACGGALAVGSLPFFVLAYFAKFLSF